MAKSVRYRGIPTEPSLEQFGQFVLPHLTLGSRGPVPKLSLHALFNYILKLLYLGCQWKELPIAKDCEGRPEIHCTRVYGAIRRWQAGGCFDLIFLAVVLRLRQTNLLDATVIHGDGTTTAAKKGGDNIGFNGHKQIKGDKVVAFRDWNCNVIAPSGLVQTYDDKPKRRLFEVLHDQGFQMNQEITFLTAGAESLRRMVGNMPPSAEHYIDWFHIAMRFTVLGQFVKGLAHHQPNEAAALEGRLDRIKWRLWHGDGREAVIRLDALAEDVDALECDYPNLKRFAKTSAEFAAYIRNNVGSIPNYGERWRYGGVISTSFVGSTVNILISKRFCKKQQMQWTPEGAHLLVQTRAQTLDGTLRGRFERWYPGLAANDHEISSTTSTITAAAA